MKTFFSIDRELLTVKNEYDPRGRIIKKKKKTRFVDDYTSAYAIDSAKRFHVSFINETFLRGGFCFFLFPAWIGSRHIVTFMLFLGMANAYIMRTNMSVAIVAMVNQTALERDPTIPDDECEGYYTPVGNTTAHVSIRAHRRRQTRSHARARSICSAITANVSGESPTVI